MKVLFINPPIREKDNPRHVPHGLAILANVLRNKGYEVSFLDINGYRKSKEEVMEYLKSSDFDVACIGGIIPTYRYVKWLTCFLKEIKPSVPIIAGGSVAFSIPELVLEKTGADIVCNQEGEETLPELLENLDNLKSVKGIWFKDNEKIVKTEDRPLITNLDSIPFPAWDLVAMETYLNNPKVGIGRDIDFISSRGCPFRCTFCFRAFGRQFRYHSVEYIIKALKHLKEKYNIDFVSFQDDEFMASKKRVYDFLSALKEADLDLKWSCTGRVNIVEEEILKAMKQGGCVSVSFGIESGSQKMLDLMQKDVKIEQAKEAVLLTRKIGLRAPTSFILGLPGETRETCEETIKFCQDANISLQALMFATPYPGTALFQYALEKGLINKENLEEFILKLDDAVDFTINMTEEFADEELKKQREYMINKVQQSLKKDSQEKIDKFYRDLYGERLWNKYLENLKDPAFLEHRKLHGFNEI